MANVKIDTVDARSKLKARHSPHFVRLEGGCYLGYRKTVATGAGSWVTRYLDPETKRQGLKSLGAFDELPAAQRFDAARKAAEVWFRHLGRGGQAQATTVEAACRAYEKHVRVHRGDTPADDLASRYGRWVYSNPKFSAIDLARLTKLQIEQWRAILAKTPVMVNYDAENPVTRARSPASLNRDMTALRAALNHALDNGSVTSDQAWRVGLRPVKNADGRRDLYLDLEQRRALVRHAPEDLALLVKGMATLPLRPGAVAALLVGWLDTRLGVLIIGKDKHGKDRRVKLPPATAAFLSGVAEGKPADAHILVQADGKPWKKDAWKGPIKEAARAAELPASTTAYTLRHSVITDLVVAGVPLLTIAQIAGTSVRMIELHYGHLRPDSATDALATLTL